MSTCQNDDLPKVSRASLWLDNEQPMQITEKEKTEDTQHSLISVVLNSQCDSKIHWSVMGNKALFGGSSYLNPAHH